MKKCDCENCICKTCAIAYVNGGAPGCGDCEKCKEEKWDTVCQCPMYYNFEPLKNKNEYKEVKE